MITSLKSEFRKLLTVRSTYFITGFVLLFVAFLSVYVFGYQQASQPATSPIYMADVLYNMLGTFVTFGLIIAILHVAHEYRYNTINYTLTLTTSRLRVLASKVIVLLSYATVMAGIVLLIAYFGAKLGLDIRNTTLVPQQLPLTEIAWQYIAYIWGYILTGVILAVLIRGLVGSIVAFFLIPTIEGILSLILKTNTKYLPFRSLDAIAATPVPEQFNVGFQVLSHTAALGVFAIYLAVFGSLAVFAFLKRDAS